MKILVVAPFDPCGVAVGHRELMRKAGHDYRVAVDFAPVPTQADWVGWGGAHLREFAHDADVIQWCPGIARGGTWTIDASAPFDADLPPAEFFRDSQARKFVAYFHGSVATWTHREKYAAFYGGRGWRLATSTLDYASELPATYLPPYLAGLPIAALREDGAPLVVAHTPTNPPNCHTPEFFGIMQRLRWANKAPPVVAFASGVPHRDVISLKVKAHACFDHLRGSFSVNTLEAAAMGLVPLVGVREEYLQGNFALAPKPRVTDVESLRTALVQLAGDAAYTREMQQAARAWFEKHFSAATTTRRLLAFYEAL